MELGTSSLELELDYNPFVNPLPRLYYAGNYVFISSSLTILQLFWLVFTEHRIQSGLSYSFTVYNEYMVKVIWVK